MEHTRNTTFTLKLDLLVQAHIGMIPVEAAEAIDARCKIEIIDMRNMQRRYVIRSLVKQNSPNGQWCIKQGRSFESLPSRTRDALVLLL